MAQINPGLSLWLDDKRGHVIGDQGGHLIASIFNGAGDRVNLVPMNANLNMGRWRSMEHQWAGLVRSGHQVQVSINAVYLGSLTRLTSFIIR